jgi:hypothetical protein
MSSPFPFNPYPANPVTQLRLDYRDGRRIGVATIVLVAFLILCEVLVASAAAWDYDVSNAVLAGLEPPADLDGADTSFGLLILLTLACFVCMAVFFWKWLWRARINAESLGGPRSQRLRRGWTVWGWLCPLANLVLPCLIVFDIHKASAPRGNRSAIVGFWWAACLAGVAVLVVGGASVPPESQEIVLVVAVACQVVAAALLVVIVAQVNSWHEPNRVLAGPARQW